MTAAGVPHQAGRATFFEEQAQLFKALGQRTRLAIVDALADGERDVSGIHRLVGSDLSTVSRHLLQLKTAGVLASRRDGKQILYRLRTPCVLTVMRCVASILDEPPSPETADTASPASSCADLCPAAGRPSRRPRREAGDNAQTNRQARGSRAT